VKPETLAILRCPYCGGGLELVEALPHHRGGDPRTESPGHEQGQEFGAEDIVDGVLGCHCCLFPVVAGIPLMHLHPDAVAALEALQAGQPEHAFRTLVAPGDEAGGERFAAAATSPGATYRGLVAVLGPGFEGEYFLHRFSDPSYVVASAVVDAVANVVLGDGGRALDLCGGSGHLTRLLVGRPGTAAVVADLHFAKLWLASRFVAPGCQAVGCDANAPLPFARGAFRLSLCADAFMFVWTKRQLVAEMARLLGPEGRGAAVITHTHNALVWSQSHGQALPPEGYAGLFETTPPHLYAETGLLEDVLAGRLDLARRDAPEALAADPALVIVASEDRRVFRPHAVTVPTGRGVLRLNPLYQAEPAGEGVRLRLHFPSPEHEEEFGACRRYLAEEVELDGETWAAVREGRRTAEVLELAGRRVLLDLPARYC